MIKSSQQRKGTLKRALPVGIAVAASLIVTGCASGDAEDSETPEPDDKGSVPIADVYASTMHDVMDPSAEILAGTPAVEAMLSQAASVEELSTDPKGCAIYQPDEAYFEQASGAIGIESEAEDDTPHRTAQILGFASADEAAQYLAGYQEHAKSCSSYTMPVTERVDLSFSVASDTIGAIGDTTAQDWVENLDQSLILSSKVKSIASRGSSGAVPDQGQLPSYVADPNSIPEPEDEPVDIDTSRTVLVRSGSTVVSVTITQDPKYQEVVETVQELVDSLQANLDRTEVGS